MRYYSRSGPMGPLWHEDVTGVIRVYEVPDDDPVGVAHRIGPDRNGLARFRLVIGGESIDGEWRLISREFTQAR